MAVTQTEERRHPRCYAAALGGCSTKISLEHPLSQAVLKLILVDGTVEIDGMSWQPADEHRRFSVRSLGCNVLCTEHNRLLAPFDAEGGKLMQALTNGLLDQGARGISWFRGDRLERFMLKVLCGFVAGAMAEAPGVDRGWTPPRDWLEVLFEQGSLSEKCGMYFIGEVGEADANSGFKASVVSNRIDGPYGLTLTLAGLPLLLAMTVPTPCPPDSLLAGAGYRPARVQYLSGGSAPKRTIELRWRSPGDGTQVTFR